MHWLLRLSITAVLLLFLGVGAAQVVTVVGQFGPANALDPLLTANHFLAILGVEQPAARLERALQDFPADARLLLVAPDAEPFSGQVRLTFNYLAYPRPVSSVSCTAPGQGRTLGASSPAGVDGIVFFKMPVAEPAGPAVTVGNMVIVHRKSAAPWQSFCR